MTPKTSMVQATATAIFYDVCTGAASPGSILRGGISFKATGSTTAGVIKLWLFDGSNRRLLGEILIPTTTPSATTDPRWGATYNDDYIHLASASWKVQAELTVANTIDIICRYQDL